MRAPADTWGLEVPSYQGITNRRAGGNYNVAALVIYRVDVVAVIWNIGLQILYASLSNLYRWSSSSGAGGMDAQGIIKHWRGLDGLYDYRLTMYACLSYCEAYRGLVYGDAPGNTGVLYTSIPPGYLAFNRGFYGIRGYEGC